MQPSLAELLQLLKLERLEINLFRGASRDIGSPQVFGGQVLGQALTAAYATVDARNVHSLHAYFLRRGDFNAPIVYEVDRSRDGHSFSSRRVVAIQHGEQIFHMSASFAIPETGLEHQIAMPLVPAPEDLPDLREMIEAQEAPLPPAVERFAGRHSPFEFRLVQPIDLVHPVPSPPRQDVWFRTVDRVGDAAEQHSCLLAYVSDYHLIGTCMRPHGYTMASPGIVIASIDHAMWFHRPMRVDEWLLYSIESPSAASARGFARACIFTREGVLVASTAQEGLLRVLDATERQPDAAQQPSKPLA
jgi:acyl-CoA thioesterase II